MLVVKAKPKPASDPDSGSLDDIEETLGRTRRRNEPPPTPDQVDLDSIFGLIRQREKLLEAGVVKKPAD